MHEEEPRVPLARSVESSDETGHDGDRGVNAPGVGSYGILESAHNFVLGFEAEVARAEAVGEHQIHPHQREEDQSEDDRQADFGREKRVVDLSNTALGEPHLISPDDCQGA